MDIGEFLGFTAMMGSMILLTALALSLENLPVFANFGDASITLIRVVIIMFAIAIPVAFTAEKLMEMDR